MTGEYLPLLRRKANLRRVGALDAAPYEEDSQTEPEEEGPAERVDDDGDDAGSWKGGKGRAWRLEKWTAGKGAKRAPAAPKPPQEAKKAAVVKTTAAKTTAAKTAVMMPKEKKKIQPPKLPKVEAKCRPTTPYQGKKKEETTMVKAMPTAPRRRHQRDRRLGRQPKRSVRRRRRRSRRLARWQRRVVKVWQRRRHHQMPSRRSRRSPLDRRPSEQIRRG